MGRRSFTFVFLILAGFFPSERANAQAPAGEFLKVKLPADVDRLTVTLELTGFTPDSTSEYLITMVVRNVNTGQQAAASTLVVPGVDHAPLQLGTGIVFDKVKLSLDIEDLKVHAALSGFTPDPTAVYLATLVIRNETNGEQSASSVLIVPK